MESLNIVVIENPEGGFSLFREEAYSLENFNGMWISERQQAQNFRHRISQPEYFSDWHVAGDPTLIIIHKGVLRIGLRDGTFRDFSAGESFIVRDRLLQGCEFDPFLHGHTAEVIGTEALHALHIKLDTLKAI